MRCEPGRETCLSSRPTSEALIFEYRTRRTSSPSMREPVGKAKENGRRDKHLATRASRPLRLISTLATNVLMALLGGTEEEKCGDGMTYTNAVCTCGAFWFSKALKRSSIGSIFQSM